MYKNRIREFYAGRLASRTTIISGFTLILAMSFIAIGCDSIVDQKTDADDSITTSAMAETFSMVQASTIECIDPMVLEYNKVTDLKTIEWGNPRNLSSKTVDIEYYNTLSQFVLRVKSTDIIADVLADDESIKDFDGLLEADKWQEFTFDLESGWQAGDTQTLNVEVAGKGPAVYFDVVYTLLGECATGCGELTFMYNGSEVTYGTVTGANDSCWLDRNLGAAQVATSSSDAKAYGDLFQWGRAADDHQLVNRFDGDGKTTSVTTEVQSNSNQPVDGKFIIGSDDWRDPSNPILWQDVEGTIINNPCPSGYRLPTDKEWDAEIATWDTENAVGAFESQLKLPAAGRRDRNHGSFETVGFNGFYWSSTVSSFSNMSRRMRFFSTSAITAHYDRAEGHSVRCMKEDTSD